MSTVGRLLTSQYLENDVKESDPLSSVLWQDAKSQNLVVFVHSGSYQERTYILNPI
jgi:hypothetical protein